MDFIKNLEILFGQNYSTIITIVAIILLIYTIYTKIKFECLKKAAEMVSKVEKYKNLTGEEKFNLVLLWINSDLPGIFQLSFFQNLIKVTIEFVYNNCFQYMKNYIKRKTGLDISYLLNEYNKDKNNDNNQQ